MTGPHVRPVPANGAMVREQIGVVGLAVRREVGFLAAGLVLLIVGAAAVALSGSLDLVVDGEPAPRLNPEDLGYLAAMIGAMSGGGEALRQGVYQPSGDRVMGWRQLPSAMTWAGATAAWFALGLGGVWAAARRHRE